MPRRFQSVEEVLALLPQHFLPEEAGETDVTVQLHLTGAGGGDWFVRIRDGRLTVSQGVAEGTPDLRVTCTVADYLALVNGEMDPLAAYMRGRVRVEGDVRLVYRLQFLFRLPED